MAAIRPLRCRLLVAIDDAEPTELGHIDVPLSIRRDGTMVLQLSRYRRRFRRFLRAIARVF